MARGRTLSLGVTACMEEIKSYNSINSYYDTNSINGLYNLYGSNDGYRLAGRPGFTFSNAANTWRRSAGDSACKACKPARKTALLLTTTPACTPVACSCAMSA